MYSTMAIRYSISFRYITPINEGVILPLFIPLFESSIRKLAHLALKRVIRVEPKETF